MTLVRLILVAWCFVAPVLHGLAVAQTEENEGKNKECVECEVFCRATFEKCTKGATYQYNRCQYFCQAKGTSESCPAQCDENYSSQLQRCDFSQCYSGCSYFCGEAKQ